MSFENRAVYEIISKNIVEPEGPQMTPEYGAYKLHAGIARLHARTRMHTPTLPDVCAHKQIWIIPWF
jgi:hypothetical protein